MPVIRTDFSDQARWEAIRAAIIAPSEDDGFVAAVEFVDDPTLAGFTVDHLLALATEETIGYQRCLLVVDAVTTASREWPVLVIDLREDRGRQFRAVASHIHSIENNLSIANMDFFEFADNVEIDGVFRGF
jgi:hypothetical protein